MSPATVCPSHVTSARLTQAVAADSNASWAVIANHGGGYQYRLCRKIKGYEVTEECFQQ